MGSVKIRYYVTRQREGKKKWGYWAPCLARRNKKTGQIEPTPMAKMGFKLIDCGEDGPAAWAIAHMWNAKWDAARRGQITSADATPPARVYPPGSLGEAYVRFKRTEEWKKKPKRTKEDWERGWKYIDPIFGDVDPRTVALEDIDLWYNGDSETMIEGLLQRVGVGEAYRAMKYWRALWRVAGRMTAPHGGKYCSRDEDPSLGIRRETPQPRNLSWRYDEVRKLVKRGWRKGMYGMAAALAVAWDSQLAPVDVRSLTLAQLKGDAVGPFFSLNRAKSGEAAIATLSHKTQKILRYYLKKLGFELLPDAPIFRTAGAAPGPKGGRRWQPRPYTKDKFASDFREIREEEFGVAEKRTVGHDFRRSGAIEAVAGGADPAALARKMANTIDQNPKLQKTYLPEDATIVRLADDARAIGRAKLRGQKGNKSRISE